MATEYRDRIEKYETQKKQMEVRKLHDTDVP